MPTSEPYEQSVSACAVADSALAGELPRKHRLRNERQSVEGGSQSYYGERWNPRYGTGSDSPQSPPCSRIPICDQQSVATRTPRHRFSSFAESNFRARLFLARAPLPVGQIAEKPSRLLDCEDSRQSRTRHSRITRSSQTGLAHSCGLAVSDSEFRQDLTPSAEVLTD